MTMRNDGSGRRPDEESRVTRGSFEALDDLDWHTEFHRRHPASAIFPTADLEALIAANVAQGARQRDLEAALAAAERRADHATTIANASDALAGEVLIRRLLDDLVEAGFASTTYQRAGQPFRDYTIARLTMVAEVSNRLLGQVHSVPASAWAARDAAHPPHDDDDDDDDADEQADLFRRLVEGDDDADE